MIKQSFAARLGRHAILIIGAVVVVAPFLWMFTTSLQTRAETFTNTSLLPTSWNWSNYLTAWEAAPFDRYYVNSIVMTAGIVLGRLLFNGLAAYAFARLRFPGRNILFFVLLGAMMVPTFVTIIPTYSIVASLGWINTMPALTVPRLADVFGIVLLRQYFSTIPVELEEAARMDGLGRIRTFFQIIAPLARPAFATVAIFSFLFAWNDFLWPLLVANTEDTQTIQVGLQAFVGRYGTSWNYLMAGTLTATVPSIIVFMFFQRALVRGIASSGLKD